MCQNQGVSSTPFSAAGAVDLGALAASKEAQARADRAKEHAPDGVILDVTTEQFETLVLQQSMSVPVVVDLWATWCQPCKTLSPILETLAVEYNGRFVLAKVDVDAEPQIGAAFQAQSIPMVVAIVGGQPVPLFQGALPESQVRQYLDQLLAAAAQAGITGTVSGTPIEELEPVEEPEDERFTAAFEAIDAGDWSAARAAYQTILDTEPSNADAAAGLALVGLYQRTEGVDLAAAIASVDPSDPSSAMTAADAHALNGDWSSAFATLIDAVKATSGDDRDAVRTRLVELFEVAGDEPAVQPARIALSNALF